MWLWSNLLNEPLFTLYTGFLSVILYKDLGASTFVIALLMTLKPVVTILSFYWSARLHPRRLKANALWAGFWMRVPFLACPWVDEVWYVVAAAANYMLFYRAGMPAWLEILKRNMREGKRERSFSLSSGMAYAEGVVLSLAIGGLLDRDPSLWKYLFFGSALMGLVGLALLGRVEISDVALPAEAPQGGTLPWKERLVRPWRDSWQLMRERPDFSLFHWGFMLAGFGLMLIQPTLPLFMVDWLKVSYLEVAAAVSIAKGLGFSLSAPLWSRWFERASIFRVSSAVFFAFGLFPLLLVLSSWQGLWWLYIAYFFYGWAQGGSHLVWNMSGPYFAGKEESVRYTGVGIMLAGLRGAVGPGLGGALTGLFGPLQVLGLGGLFFICSGVWFFKKRTSQFAKVGLQKNR